MTGIENGAQTLIDTWGVPGVFLIVLASVIVFLWRDIKSKEKLIGEIQEKRLQDVLIYTNGIERFRETNEKLTDDFKATVDQLRVTVDHLRGLK